MTVLSKAVFSLLMLIIRELHTQESGKALSSATKRKMLGRYFVVVHPDARLRLQPTQCSAPPLAAGAARLINRETLALRSLIRGFRIWGLLTPDT